MWKCAGNMAAMLDVDSFCLASSFGLSTGAFIDTATPLPKHTNILQYVVDFFT